MVETSGLENRQVARPRGFESHPIRRIDPFPAKIVRLPRSASGAVRDIVAVMNGRVILVLNSGTSSLKFALFEEKTLAPVANGSVMRIGVADTVFQVRGDGIASEEPVSTSDRAGAASLVADWIRENADDYEVAAVGHRIVQGGPRHFDPEIVTDALIIDLKAARSLDPEHVDDEIAIVEAFRQRLPDVPHVAAFDTGFHQAMPRVAQLVSLPRRLALRRYGFHGLSYEYLMRQLSQADKTAAEGKVVVAHLGSGSSLAAVAGGKAIDTSMSVTPNSGVMMGTRAGNIDAGLVRSLTEQGNLSVEKLAHLLDFESGLLGVSEISSDMYDLLQKEAEDERAADAVALFCYQVKKEIGALAAALGGLDTLVFSGGMGDKAPKIRARVCEGLEFLGVAIDPAKNAQNAGVISSDSSAVRVRVIPTCEECAIAHHVRSIVYH